MPESRVNEYWFKGFLFLVAMSLLSVIGYIFMPKIEPPIEIMTLSFVAVLLIPLVRPRNERESVLMAQARIKKHRS